jgi:hypothetical protein
MSRRASIPVENRLKIGLTAGPAGHSDNYSTSSDCQRGAKEENL